MEVGRSRSRDATNDAALLGAEPAGDERDRARTRAKVLGGLFGAATGDPQAPVPDRLAGRFEVLEHLGTGAMGDVVLARDEQLGRRVAIKRVATRGEHAAPRRRRILREAQALAKVMHPNVVALFDVETDGDDVLLAMEYVEGTSLRAWLTEPRPWTAVAEAYHQVARGLAAVHTAGLVHRDGKPDNLLRGAHGIVRVADLGLARLQADADEASESSTRATSEPLAPALASGDSAGSPAMTRTGALVGTPLYMAPELLDGDVADARSDQFAFGVSLYEALFGARPFDERTVPELRAVMAAGPPSPPASAPRVPAWLTRLVVRTLQPDPARRWPTMHEIATALDPARRRRRMMGGLVGLGAVGLVATTWGLTPDPAPAAAATPDPCPRTAAAFDDTYDDARRNAITERVRATLRPAATANAVATAITTRADAYRTRWLDAQQRACRATHVEHVQSAEDLQRQQRCLARGRRTLAQLLSQVQSADADALERIPAALSRLSAPRSCERGMPDDEARPPADAEIVADLDRARAQWFAAAFDDATASLDAAEAALELRPDDRLRAELAFGRGEVARGRDDADAVANHYLQAAELAEASRQYRLAAITWLRMVSHAATAERDAAQADFYLSRARAAVARLDSPPRLSAGLQLRIGQRALAAGEHADAVTALTESRRLYEADEADELTLAPVQMDLGRAQYQAGNYDDAAETFAAVVATYERAYGPVHPRVASALNNLGSTLVMADRLDEAETTLRRALQIRRDHFGDAHAKVAQTLNALAGVALQRGDLEGALQSYREALSIGRAAHGPDHPVLAANMINVGRTLSRLGRHDAAVEQIRAAVAHLEAAHGRDHPLVADALHGLGAAEVEAEAYDDAVADYERALRLRTTAFGADSGKAAETGVSLAEAQRRAGDTKSARVTIDRWLPILRAVLGPDHASVQQAERTRVAVEGDADGG